MYIGWRITIYIIVTDTVFLVENAKLCFDFLYSHFRSLK